MGIEIIDEEELNIETNDGWNELPYEEKDPVFKASAAYGISSTNITNWNNKSEFSGNYNDLTDKPVIPTNSDFTLNGLSEKSYNNLTDKPSIPSKTSDLTNDSGFITNAVDNLLNYYKKSETFTKQEVNNLLDEKADTEDIPDLTDYVKNTDYATISNGGVIKVNDTRATEVSSFGTLFAQEKTYSQYNSADRVIFISKGTLENIITGKGLVSNTNYATTSTGGVIKPDNGFGSYVTGDGKLRAVPKTLSDYNSATEHLIVAKGTLENVLDARIGDIDTILETLTTGTGV